jgi:hypothetical protein
MAGIVDVVKFLINKNQIKQTVLNIPYGTREGHEEVFSAPTELSDSRTPDRLFDV